MLLTTGSGSGSGSCYFCHWPSRRQHKTNLFKGFSAYYFLKVHLHHFSKTKSKKKSQNSRNQGFSYYFCLLIEGLTSGSWSGSRRPKNIWIRRIRIRNTDINIVGLLCNSSTRVPVRCCVCCRRTATTSRRARTTTPPGQRTRRMWSPWAGEEVEEGDSSTGQTPSQTIPATWSVSWDRRKIRRIEISAKCRYLKNYVKGLCGSVLSLWGPLPSYEPIFPAPFTHCDTCTQYTVPVLITQRRGVGGGES